MVELLIDSAEMIALRLEAENALCGSVRESYAVVGIHDQDGIGRGRQDIAQLIAFRNNAARTHLSAGLAVLGIPRSSS